ncbi:rhomboid family intramembrane serine protease [Solicola sp. PLA-1-18]|uniref:rhomboid family intramembrane serine protease n=1 Tax=Solicola sp. PLA-1-18 TaxID=3380532 RepID=UPI003B80E0D4
MSQPVNARGRGVVATTMGSAVPVLVLVALMWAVEAVDTLPGTNFDANGIYPRAESGLFGIVASPFLHADFSHLIANTGAFVVMGILIAVTTRHFWAATIGIALFGGLGTWLIATPGTIHIGASGVVYGYAAFLVTWGLLARRLLNIAVAVAVAVLYGGIVWGVLPGQPGISWQGHLCGALAGVLMAWWLSRGLTRSRFRAV